MPLPDDIKHEDLEFKTFETEFKTVGDEGVYEGHFSVFGNIDDGDDIVHPGSFAKTIRERRNRIKVFYAHDWMKLIGPPPDVLEEDSVGLYAKGRLTLGSFWGRETWALMKDKALTEGSFGFWPVKWDYEEIKDQMIRHLRELLLIEISPVPLGMNPLTDVNALKALQAAQTPKEKIEVFTALVKTLTEADITKENADSWSEAMQEMSSLLTAFEKSQGAAEPRKHSALLERRLRVKAAELALLQEV